MYIGNGWQKFCKEIDDFYRHRNKASASTVTDSGIHTGVISGDFVSDDSGSYAYTMAVDVPISDGAYVRFEVSNNIAVIVGVV